MFVGCGLLLAAVMLCFAELSTYFRSTGGPILYTRTAFGPLAGFETGWAFYVARVTAFAANLNLLIASIGFFWPGAEQGAIKVALIALVVGLLAWVNVVGVRAAMRSISVLTILKFLPLVLLALFGLSYLPAHFATAATALPDIGAVGTAALLVIYAFVGWEAAVVPAGETREPQRDMPRGLFWALGVVTLLYVVVQAVSIAVHPDLATSERALVEVGGILFGPAGALLLTVGVVVSVGGNIASTVVTAPRLTYALARDGTLPAWLGEVHPRFRTPVNSILFFAVLAFALAVYGSFLWLAAMSALVRVLIYMACIASMPRLRRQFGAEASSFRMPGGWTIPAGAFLVCGLLLVKVSVSAVAVTASFLAVGAVIYWLMRRR
ncbi:MAG: APC family permease [Xanthomonadaceae bacterium]|nr:APC family permease [Xanthomonadaceae bacterium]